MADEKVIDLDRLSRFHDNLKSNGLPLNNWQANKKYKVGYTVIQDGKYYRCKTEHTSTTTFDATKFDLVGGSGIQNWAANTSYSVGDLVVYGNGIYQCKTAHTSTTTFNDTKWRNLSIGYEKENLYIGTTFNTSTLTVTTSNSMLTKDFLIVKIAYSEDGSTVLMNRTFALVPVIGEVQDFSYQESITDYIVVTGEITDATTFVFNFLEAYTIDNFKVVSIDGVTLGSSSSSGGSDSGLNISKEILWSGNENTVTPTGTTLSLTNNYTDYDYLLVYFGYNDSQDTATIKNIGLFDCSSPYSNFEYVFNSRITSSTVTTVYVDIDFSGSTWKIGRYVTTLDNVYVKKIVGIKFTPNPNNYSTTEQEIGTWIDGKKLYQKTFVGTTGNVGVEVSLGTISDLDNVIDISGIVHHQDGYLSCYYSYWYSTTNHENVYVYISTSNELLVGALQSTLANKDVSVTVKYTKV